MCRPCCHSMNGASTNVRGNASVGGGIFLVPAAEDGAPDMDTGGRKLVIRGTWVYRKSVERSLQSLAPAAHAKMWAGIGMEINFVF